MANNGKLIHPATLGGEGWRSRALRATRDDDLMRCFLLAVLGWQTGLKPPRFGRVARISANGLLYSNMQDINYRIYPNHCLGMVETVIENFRRLADHLKLNDADRKEMFLELKKWIARDDRANQTNEERGLNK